MGELERYKEALAEYASGYASLAGYVRNCGVLGKPEILDFIEARSKEINAVLNPLPEMETVEVERWMCTSCDELHDFSHVMERCGAKLNERGDVCASTGYVKLTGTFQRPKPVKVERTWQLANASLIEGRDASGICRWVRLAPFPDDVPTGKVGTLTFTWQE